MDYENVKNSLLSKIDALTNEDNTRDVFEMEISRSGWYKKLGYSRHNASIIKKRFYDGEIGEIWMGNILEKLGWKKTVFWEKS